MPLRESMPMSSKQLGKIVEDAAAEIYIFDADTYHFRLVNRGARENLQYSAEELSKLTPWDLKPEFDEPSFKQIVEPLLSGKSAELKFETKHQRADGSLYDVSVHLHLLRSEGEPVFFAAIRDITGEHRLARELMKKTEELQEALEAKEILLHEVNHRVKNSLQVITSLLQLQSNQSSDQSLKSALQEARNRVAVVASIHQRLYSTSQHATLDFGQFLSELAEQTVSHMALGGMVKAELDLPEGILLSLDKGVPLSLITNEIMTNSIKYAFPEGGAGTVKLSLRFTNGKLRVIIADDGVGLSKEFGSADTQGLGTRIIKALAQQVRAELTVETGATGTSFILDVPMEGQVSR